MLDLGSSAVQKANRLVYSIGFALSYSPEGLRSHNKNRKAVCQYECITSLSIRQLSSFFLYACPCLGLPRIRPILSEAT
jgi:hypothetical protein